MLIHAGVISEVETVAEKPRGMAGGMESAAAAFVTDASDRIITADKTAAMDSLLDNKVFTFVSDGILGPIYEFDPATHFLVRKKAWRGKKLEAIPQRQTPGNKKTGAMESGRALLTRAGAGSERTEHRRCNIALSIS
jgi:hypothetical protein